MPEKSILIADDEASICDMLSRCASVIPFIEQHMGTIRVEPVEDGGVCVCVRLPASGEGKRENAG